MTTDRTCTSPPTPEMLEDHAESHLAKQAIARAAGQWVLVGLGADRMEVHVPGVCVHRIGGARGARRLAQQARAAGQDVAAGQLDAFAYGVRADRV